jgi:hypothetical protein
MIIVKDQSGGTLLYVMMVGLVISLAFAGFMQGTVGSEQRAVD